MRRIEDSGLERQTIVARMDENEALAQLVAEAVRGVVESDLAAKRALLTQAAIRALEDDAVVDVEQRVVRTATQLDTVDIRILAILADPPSRTEEEKGERVEGATFPEELVARGRGLEEVASAAVSSLIATGLVENVGIGTYGGQTFWKLTSFAERFLDRLRAEGLGEELRSREHG